MTRLRFGIGKGEKTEQLATKSLADSCSQEILTFVRNIGNWWNQLEKWPIIVENWWGYTIMITYGHNVFMKQIVKLSDAGKIEFSYDYETTSWKIADSNFGKPLQTTDDYAKVYQELIDIFSAANERKPM